MDRRLQPSFAGAADDRHAVVGRRDSRSCWPGAQPGSLLAALLAVAIHIALEPRHYNYPKLVLYAAAIALAWAYVDRPTRPRLAALGAMVGVGFLFRHDHLLYLGALGLMTVALVHRGSIRQALPAAARLSTVAALFVVPFFAFLALNGGIGEYFRLASIYVQRDAQRTSFSLSASFFRFFETAGRD